MGKKKCYIYTRVSTAIQVDGYSLDAQTERLREYADYKDYEIAGEYCDAGKSGMSIKGRPEFQNMMNDIVSCKDDISAVLVFKLSRFGRNAADVLKSMQILEDFDISLICVDDAIDSSTQGGKLTMAILSAVAEIEHENITVQFMAARMQKISKGGWPGGPAPFGYRISAKKLVIEETEADLVRTIFDTYLQDGMNTSSTVNVLNEKGILRPDGKVITSDFVRGIVRNPIYSGIIMFNRRSNNPKIKMNPKEVISAKGIHEPIITEEVFAQTQSKLENLAKQYSYERRMDKSPLLSGLVKCPICGNSMISKASYKPKPNSDEYYKPIYSYGCNYHTKKNGRTCSFHRQYNQEKIEGAVFEIVSRLTMHPLFKQMVMDKFGTEKSKEQYQDEMITLRKSLQAEMVRKQKLGEDLDNLDVLSDSYDSEYDRIQESIDASYDRISEIEDSIKSIKNKILSLTKGHKSADSLELFLNNIPILFNYMNGEEQKQLYRLIIERIDLFPEKQADGRILKGITFKIPVYLDMSDGYMDRKPDDVIKIHLESEDIEVTSSEAKATYAQIKEYILTNYDTKVSTLYIAQTKRKYGIEVGEASNKSKGKSRVPTCPKSKEEKIVEALKYYKMLDASVTVMED